MRRGFIGLAIVLIAGLALAAPQSSTINPEKPANPVIDAEGVYHVGNGVTAPKLVYSVDAEFSEAARRKGINGTVMVALTVMLNGQVANVHVKRSAAEDFTKAKDRKAAATLDEKALEAIRQYRFEPGSYKGKPVPVAISIDVNFHIYPNR